MSLENDDGSSAMEVSESINESEKKPRISYTRDLLLSLSELEICKTLPSGFDQSILSEFEDSTNRERPRIHGSLPTQGFRRNDYSSSPPTHGDSRGHGRWDNRSSGWNDKDADSQSDMDPDSGRRGFGNQSRRPWNNNSEHDGLLGSGSFPRPSGFTAGTSAPKGTNRSNEAYQPPRPFKAIQNSRPNNNTHDSFNDETFGSSESTSQDKAEEERKRRASFELMRKEQQKVLQEKQKSSGNKPKNDPFTDLETKEDDSGKSSILLQSSKPRPLVPPGFKTSTVKPTSSIDKENPKPGIEEINLIGKGNHTQNGTLENHILGISGFPEAVDGEVLVNKNKIISNSSEESSSILGSLFGGGPAIKDGGPTGFLEQKIKPDVQSSRFAQWFNEDEKKPVDELSSNRPTDLLSLIGGGDKAIISTDSIAPELSYTGFKITKTPSDSKHLYNSFMQESAPAPPVAAVLTCEDLEQTILSEYSEKSQPLMPPVPDWTVSHQENVDNHATNHLLSLLQKGTAIDDTAPDTNTSPLEDRPEKSKSKSKDGNQEGNPGQNLSLEALFGTAFMKELQSGQAPVSAQRGSARIDIIYPNELSDPVMNGPLSSTVDGVLPNMKHFDGQRVNVDPPRSGEFHLPEEESLIMVADPANTHNQNVGNILLQSDVAFDISEKLAALNSGNRFVQFNNNNVMNNNRRPVFHPMDPMNNTQMRYPGQQFPTRPGPFHHHPDATRVTGFDVPQMLPPQMRTQGNFPPPQQNFPPPQQLLRDLARPGNREAAMHGFPFAHQQANIGGIGMPLPVGDGSSGSNHHLEAFQRMMDMEMRAQSKQQGLDMGFRYR